MQVACYYKANSFQYSMLSFWILKESTSFQML